MTVDCPLTCYICGETEDRTTVDLIGCLYKSEEASERFEEKHGKEPDSYLDICPECKDRESKQYIDNIVAKYGVYKAGGNVDFGDAGEKPYQCPVDGCSYGGLAREHLEDHYSDVHGGELPEEFSEPGE